jgi:hypothetical protein
MFVFIILICADICWHVWEYRERKRLDRCWEHLFNAKLESEQRLIGLVSKISQKKE